MKTVLPPENLDIAGQPFVLRDATQHDAADILQLHQRVFGSAVDAAWFDWKYVLGAGEGVGLWGAGGLVAFCGGTPRWVWWRGQRMHCLQVGDVMVAPEWRGLFTRKSPFYLVCQRLYHSRLGAGRDFVAGFGFPNVRHLQLAVKTRLSWDAGTVEQWHWPVPEGRPCGLGWRWRARPVDAMSHDFDVALERAWAAMRASAWHCALGERNASYWRWRFAQRPDRQYRFVALRSLWRRQPEGLAVFALPTQARQPLFWLDWAGPPALLPLARAAGLALAAQEGAAGLDAWISPALAPWLADTASNASVKTAAGVGVPRASFFSADQLASFQAWWMGGDTDFL